VTDTYTIAAAARTCGVARRTLQRAIQTGRLPLTADHRLTGDALRQAGYAPGTAPQRHAAATDHSDTAATHRSDTAATPQRHHRPRPPHGRGATGPACPGRRWRRSPPSASSVPP